MSDQVMPEIFELAADIIEIDGWVQLMPKEGQRRCASDAIRYAANQLGLVGNECYWASDRMANWLRREGCIYNSVPSWNDAVGRTKNEVLAGLRQYAQHLREEQA